MALCTLPLMTLGNVRRKTRTWLSTSKPALNGTPKEIPWVLMKSLSDFMIPISMPVQEQDVRTYHGN